MMIRSIKTLLTLTGMAVLGQQVQAVPVLFIAGAQINFLGGGNFDFTPAGAASKAGNNFSFTINSSLDPSLSIGDVGTMTAPVGGWSFNPFTGVVSGTGVLDIEDGAGVHLTADLTWGHVTGNGFGTGATLNGALALNLSNVSYIGLEPDLAAFLPGGIETLSFTFPNGFNHTLNDLASTPQHASFSGSLTAKQPTVPDGGLTAALLGSALLVGESLRRRMMK